MEFKKDETGHVIEGKLKRVKGYISRNPTSFYRVSGTNMTKAIKRNSSLYFEPKYELNLYMI